MQSAPSLAQYLVNDHARFDADLSRAIVTPVGFDLDAFACFRARILRHIEIEESLLLTGALSTAWCARIEHCALALLVDAPPSRHLVGQIRQLLLLHIGTEKGPGGALDQHMATVSNVEQERLAQRALAHPFAERPSIVRADAPRTALNALLKAEREFRSSHARSEPVPVPADPSARTRRSTAGNAASSGRIKRLK